MRPGARLSLVALGCAGCREEGIRLLTDPSLETPLADYVALLGSDAVTLEISSDPRVTADDGDLVLATGGGCEECYVLDESDGILTVTGGGVLGVQYGLADVLERAGFRFFHPHATLVPEDPRLPASFADAGEEHEPEVAHRALHLHTLHPTDALFDLWVPSGDGVERAARIVDWMVKNRANHLEWMGLDDITDDDEAWSAWREHTASLLDRVHARGLTAGVGVELYGSGNLQHAYDLLDAPGDEAEDRIVMATRLERILGDLPWDVVSLSFGEFFDEDPDRFIRDVDTFHALATEACPGVGTTAWVHVGDDVRVEYGGEGMIYYFLVKYADPAVLRSVHTVMYYNLFDDAGGAYHHEDFSEHRTFLLDELESGHPVEYYPESSYWVAFDVSVPQFFPVYVPSRWRDLAGLQEETTSRGLPSLPAHTLFSTAWEWGYWMNDLLTLRMTWSLPADWREGFDFLFAPWGTDGARVADAVSDLAALQYDALLGQRLAGWLAGVDAAMEAGYLLDIVSQPRRTSLEEAAELDPSGREALIREVLDPLARLAAETDAIGARLAAVPREDQWLREIRDGVAVDVARARFVEALYRAVLAEAEDASPDAWRAIADEALDDARVVVASRHAALHDPLPDRLLEPDDNPTLYDYGYLRWANELCYWERERVQLANLLDGSSEVPPGCLF